MLNLLWIFAAIAAAVLFVASRNRKSSSSTQSDTRGASRGAGSEPSLRKAGDFAVDDVGSITWDPTHNPDLLVVGTDQQTVEWRAQRPDHKGKYSAAWVPIRSEAHLHSGDFSWDFVVEEIGEAQIGVGFMLLWDQGLDWGFFGYLGAGSTAWSYDPSTGDVVTQTKSIAGGLPTFLDGRSGTVSVRLHLPRSGPGQGVFVVDGEESPVIELPVGAVVVPAACLLKEGQRIRLANFERHSGE